MLDYLSVFSGANSLLVSGVCVLQLKILIHPEIHLGGGFNPFEKY